jgi:hypothetical protein
MPAPATRKRPRPVAEPFSSHHLVGLLDDTNDAAGARLNDEALIVHHSVVIFRVTWHGLQFDVARQRLADYDTLTHDD